jgi:hypothetical protein
LLAVAAESAFSAETREEPSASSSHTAFKKVLSGAATTEYMLKIKIKVWSGMAKERGIARIF